MERLIIHKSIKIPLEDTIIILKHKPIIKARWHRNRLRKANVQGSFTDKEWFALCAKYNYTCLSCLKREPEIILTIDHIVPISKGGTGDIDNIQPLCLSCNCSKFDKIIDYRIDYAEQGTC